MKSFIAYIFIQLAICQMVFAQDSEWGTFVEIDFPKLDQISLDNQGFIFVADPEGNLYQYNKSGALVNNFSPHRQGRLSQLEAAWTINVFTYSTDLQEYRILDRFINPVSDNRIPFNLITLAKVATLGNNNIIWVFDEADMALKQLDFKRSEIVQNQPLNLILDRSSLEIKDMREYQNLLFIHILNEGIFVLDNQANFIKKIPAAPTQKLGFWKGFMVFLENQEIVTLGFQSEKREIFDLPEDFEATGILMNQQMVLLYSKSKIRMYQKSNSPFKGLK